MENSENSEKPKNKSYKNKNTQAYKNKKLYDVKYQTNRYHSDESFRQEKIDKAMTYYQLHAERIKARARERYNENKRNQIVNNNIID